MNQSAAKKRRGSASRAENCLPDTSKASAGFCGVARLCTARNLTKSGRKENRDLAAGQDSRAAGVRHIANQAKQDTFSAKGAVQFQPGASPQGFDHPYDKALKARFSVQPQTYRSSKSTPCATSQDRRLHKVTTPRPACGEMTACRAVAQRRREVRGSSSAFRNSAGE